MLPVAYLHCELCNERRLFVSIEEAPPIDENLSICEVCSFSFGYALVDVVENGKRTTICAPAIEPEIMRAGMQAVRSEFANRLLGNRTSPERQHAQNKLDSALADPNLATRRALIPAPTPTMDPGLASRVLSPNVPSRNRPPGRGDAGA